MTIGSLAAHYERFASWFEATSGSDRAAHLHAGLAIWLIAALILRAPLRSFRPLIVVMAAEAANECIDRVAHGSWRWPDTTGDIISTLFWPIVIMLLLRLAPRLRR